MDGNTALASIECAELKKTLAVATRVLNHLERQKVELGAFAPPHVLIELEEKRDEIRRFKIR
ncbi:MAG: hypothetical protein J5I90_20020 [Caldilineales bacterium]|nr:hypothetical protein [Caldilineales bacterium]